MKRRILTLLVAPVLLAACPPAVAQAGTYKAYSCKTPSGRIAPIDGWQRFQNAAQFSTSEERCSMGAGLEGALNGDFQQPSGSAIGWQFVVPNGIDLAGFKLWRHYAVTAAAEANATPVAYTSWPSENLGDGRGTCVAGEGCRLEGASNASVLSGTDLFEVAGIDPGVRTVNVLAGCGGSTACVDRNSSTPMALAVVKAFEARLRDTSAPTVSAVGGTLASKPVHSGVEELSFFATDEGAGVYRAVTELKREGEGEFRPVATQTVNLNDLRCVDVDTGNADPYEFFYRVPCAAATDARAQFDTASVPNGVHEIRVAVEDAAGNRSTVLGATPFRVSNASSGASSELLGAPTNGVGASNQVRISVRRASRRAAKRLRFGQSYRLIATIRNETGAPVTGATVEVLQRVKLAGRRFVTARKPIVTGRRGQVRWTVPAGTSRTLQLAYRANLLNQSYQATVAVPLEVAAKTTLRRNRSSYRNGQTIRFRGAVRSKPIPKGGVLIDLQAYKRGTGWVTFATKRSSRRGRWRIDYRLSSTTSTVRYRFRARVRQDSGYPYSAGRTKPISVLVRP